MRIDESNKVTQYINDIFAPEDALLRQMRAKGEELYAGMQISPSEGKTLQVLAKMCNAKHALEVGTFIGTSTIWMARAMGRSGKIITLESSEPNANIADRFFQQAKNEDIADTQIMRGDALETLPKLVKTAQDKPFDLVFIDASKRDYMKYLTLIEPMVKSGGVIVGDNTLLFGAMVGADELQLNNRVSHEAKTAMTAFNHRLADPKYYHGVMIPTSEGLTIAVKK